MKTELKKLKVKFEGKLIEIDIQKELSINENIINSQLRESPSSYYVLASLRDKYIKERDALAREKEEAYSNAWLYYKDANERWNNEYVSHKANLNKKYSSINERYLKAVEKAKEKNLTYHVGNVLSSDLFYHADNKADKWIKMGCLATEMESYALFANAAYAGKKALTLLTVSDSLVTNEETTAEEREKTFTAMMEVALEIA